MALFKSAPAPLAQGQRLADDDTLNQFLAFPAVSSTYNQSAAGAALASATKLTSVLNQLSVVAAATGVALAAMVPGQYQDIYHDGVSALTVYAPAGYTVDTAASVALAAASRCRYTCFAPGIIKSSLLGAVSA